MRLNRTQVEAFYKTRAQQRARLNRNPELTQRQVEEAMEQFDRNFVARLQARPKRQQA
jgi:hypothetical protein